MTNQIAVPKIGMTLSRDLMPQFSADNIKGFISYLKTKGVKCRIRTVDTNNLKSTQSEFDADKITNIMFQNEDDRRNKIIVSNDDYVLDGHHRWLADHNKDGSTEAYIIDLPILELLRMSKEYLNTINALNEEITHKEFGPMMDSFVSFASDHLGIKSLPKVRYKSPDEKFSSFGAYSPTTSEIVIQTKNRHPIDVLRTLAHELVHHSQREKGEITDKNVEESGKTGSHIENKANAEAGVIMRKYGKKNPKMFESGALVEEYLAEMTKMTPNRARYKALFYAGGPGSGKDYVAKETGYGHGLTEINSDHAFEHLLGKEGLSKTMPPEEEPKRTSVREKAKGITKTRQNLHLNARNGIIINTTGHDHEKIKAMKGKLEGMGYDTKMVFVNTSDAVSKQRNIARGQGGGRTVPEKTRSEYWKKAQKSIPHYKKMFGDEHFHHVDNSLDLSSASKEEKIAKKGEFTNVFKTIRKWARSKPFNPVGAAALEQKLKARRKPAAPESTPAAPKKPAKRTIASVVSPEVTAQAKALGLKHWGSGFHGPRKKGPKGTPIITHRTVGDKLVRIRKTPLIPKTPIQEDLRKWFDPKHPEGGWKRINAKGEAIGPCAREKGEPKPKCMSNEKRAKLTKKERAAAVSSKRRNDPNPERKGKPINVSNFGKGKLEEENKPTNPELWARAKSLAKQKFDVYPCVPMDSQAITKEGLKTYEELSIGEEILTYNMTNDVLEWKPITHLHFYENAPLKKIYKSTGFSIRATENHKWVVRIGNSYDKVSLVETKDIHKRMRLITCATLENNDGNILEETWSKKDNWVSKILSWPKSMREVYLASSIVYDGHDVGGSTKIKDRHTFGFSQKNDDHFWAALLAAYLNGYHVSFYEKTESISGASIIRNKKYHGTQNLVIEDDKIEDVWCPTTDNETWVMVQNGFITITGNSAYANGWASKWYKSKGGGWKSVNEEFETYVASGRNAPDAGDTLPGRTLVHHPLVPESKKQMKLVKKKKVLAQEDGILDTASGAVGLPVSDSIGPEFGVAKSPSLIGGLTGVSPMSQGAYMSVYPFGTYGIAEEKKTFTQLREGMDKFIAQGTVASQGYKDDDDGRVVGEASPAWQRKEGKNPEGGLNRKGVESYRRENPGSKLQTAVTTKPSKLKKGSKSWKRRKSFCARMSGMPGPMKDEKGRPTRKALSLRKWNCEE